MMETQKWWQWVGVSAAVITAVFLRLYGLDWDGYRHFHPDERYIAWVATTIEWPERWSWQPHDNPLNPFYWPAEDFTEGIRTPQDEPRDFAYGHLPLYMGVMATRAVEAVAEPVRSTWPQGGVLVRDVFNAAGRIEFRHLTAVARALTALLDAGTVLLTFWLGRRLAGPAVGVLAAWLLALTVMHIQLAHFFTADPYMTFFVVAAVGAWVHSVGAKRPTVWLLLGAAMAGLAIGSKFSAVLLALPLLVAVSARGKYGWLRRSTMAGMVTAVVFALTNPFAVLDNTCAWETDAIAWGPVQVPAVEVGNCYLENITRQRSMVGGGGAFPFTRQYAGTQPYLYPAEMQARWGMGLPLAAAGLVGLGWLVWRSILAGRQTTGARNEAAFQAATRRWWIVAAWLGPFLLTTGNFYVKFMRYLQPAIPFVVILAATAVWSIRSRRLRAATTAVVVGGTAVYALAFSNLYTQTHPWLSVSAWMYENVPAESVIVSEVWDQMLPSSLVIGDESFSRSQYDLRTVNWLSGAGANDDEEKVRQNMETLAQADYLVLSSHRSYAVVPRLPDVYPLSHRFHPLLLDGELGFEIVLVADRPPELGGVHFVADLFHWVGLERPSAVREHYDRREQIVLGRADESFLVYDHPLTLVLRNTGRLSAEELARQLDLGR